MSEPFTPDSSLAARVAPSSNFGARRAPTRPDCVILHYTGMPTAEAALALLRDPASEVSSHYLVFESGEIAQLVAEDKRAWHAGVAVWGGAHDINSSSIGVEIANPGHDGGSPPSRRARSTRRLRWSATFQLGAPFAPSASSPIPTSRRRRQARPRRSLSWDALARAGVGHWVAPAPIEGAALYRSGEEEPAVRALQAMLALYGYGLELTGVYNAPTRAVVIAFQRHFRPARVDGEVDASTLATLRALIDGLPRA